jgi:hypothetical protein
MLNSPIADSLHRAADHFDETDPPLDLVIEAEKVEKNEGGGARWVGYHRSKYARRAARRIAYGTWQKKYQSREHRARVHKVLMDEWDPIGVAGEPGAANEYDTYGDKACVMLIYEQASEQAVATYLFEIATKDVGLTNVADLAERSNRAASLLTPRI